ncbi:hypothetical protein [Pseudoalteromonas sp. R3]|uniref:hypothetical protein n=1 Tax=Pseudoalteromonas sp. R3 TaxID=1709477 RepID=UPI0006B64C4B|nr:hypothetical protein [Pseudoalteromonas sp. R3]AZZ98244.1 hypothetical protein ELR70_14645 [Pseudoalteromonas sp. R3]
MAWFNAQSVNATNGSNVIQVVSGESVANIRPGDGLIIGSFNPVEVNRAYATNQGQYIELLAPWDNATQSQVPALVMPTSGDFNSAVTALKNANTMVNDNVRAMVDWQTKMGSVQFTDLDGNVQTVKSLRLMQSEVDSANPYPWAMRKCQMEAIRQQNLERYAASGWVHFGTHRHDNAGYVAINDGLFTETTAKNILNLGSGLANSGSPKKGRSSTDEPVLHMAGLIVHLSSLSVSNAGYQANRIKLPPAESGTRTYESATGVSVTHATAAIAFASETETNKVVTDRVDMWGFELYLREINESDPFVYANGLIQSQATHIHGVPTTADTVRASSYFAWYEADDSSRGKGVNWQYASESQRMAIASDPAHNIYFDDSTGKFYQWCVRGRSFVGLGNGDWESIDSTKDYFNFSYARSSSIQPQGLQNQSTAFRDSSLFSLYVGGGTIARSVSAKPYQRGLFQVRTSADGANPSDFGIDGHCYFLVCGTVNRLNQGAYHPSFNPLGCGYHAVGSNPGSTSHGSRFGSTDIVPIASRSDTFDPEKVRIPSENSNVQWGAIGHLSGRPDGKSYDAIYSSGQGGVCRDMRYGAIGLGLPDFSESDLKVKASMYRGWELLSKTEFIPRTVTVGAAAFFSSGNNSTVSFATSDSDNPRNTAAPEFQNYNASHWLLAGDNGNTMIIERVSSGQNFAYWPFNNNTAFLYDSGDVADEFNSKFPVGTKIWLGAVYPSASPVSAEYLHTDVLGSPANILQCADLKEGWIGCWLGVPNGQKKWSEFRASRPTQATVINTVQTDDLGAAWTISTHSFNTVLNSPTAASVAPVGRVEVWVYNTNAKLTRASNISPIYKGRAGIGNVFLSQNYLQRDLCYSLTGKIVVRSSHARSESTVPLRDQGRLFAGLFYQTSPRCFDLPDTFPLPDNNSPALLALDYAVVQDGMAYINYAYIELKFNGTDWGSDGNVHMTNGQGTMLDDNGDTVAFGTGQLVEPLGWV